MKTSLKIVVIIHLCLLLSQVHKSSSLQCKYCLSHKSWDECNKKAVIVNCSEPLNVCVKYHKIVTYPSGHQEPLFEKRCYYDKECSNEKCRIPARSCNIKSSWCEMNCCNVSLCNYGMTSVWEKQQKLTIEMQKQTQWNNGNVVESKHGIIAVMLLMVALETLIIEHY